MTNEHNYWKRAATRPLSRRTMLRGAGLAGAGLAGAALIGCSDSDGDGAPGGTSTAPSGTGTAEGEAKRGGLWQGVATNDPPTIDPYGNLSFLTKATGAFAYSRLYKVGNEGVDNPWAALPVPDVAEGAETEDGKTWTVKLRQGVKYHNKPPVSGRELTTEDVVFSWKRLSAPESPGFALVQSAGWEDVEAIDDYTLRFTLDAPRAPFLDDLADTNKLMIMPVEADGGFDPRQVMIGTGPWMLDEYEPATAFNWSAHPDYFLEGLPYLDGARYSIIPEYANRLAQFRAGNLHEAGINTNDVISVRENTDAQWRGVQSALLSFMFFSPEDKEPNAPWRDERFRFAMSMALDRPALSDLAYNVTALRDAGLEVADTFNNIVPAGFGARWWLDPQSEEQGPSSAYFAYNPEEARKLIAAGGWEGATFPYRYAANAYGSTFNSVAEATGNFILQLGLQPQTQVEDYASRYVTNTFVGDFTGTAFGYETPFPEVGGYFPRMFGDDPANHGKVHDDEITELTRLQGSELDEDQRREYIHEIQRISDSHMYYVPNQAGAGTGWDAFQSQVRGIRVTRGYGDATENLIHQWLDA